MLTWALSLAAAPGNATCCWTSSMPRARAERPRRSGRGAHPARGRCQRSTLPGPLASCRHPWEPRSGWPLRPWGAGHVWFPSQRQLQPLFRFSERTEVVLKVKGEPADVHPAPCLRTPDLWARPFFRCQILRKAVSRALGVSLKDGDISISGKLLRESVPQQQARLRPLGEMHRHLSSAHGGQFLTK